MCASTSQVSRSTRNHLVGAKRSPLYHHKSGAGREATHSNSDTNSESAARGARACRHLYGTGPVPPNAGSQYIQYRFSNLISETSRAPHVTYRTLDQTSLFARNLRKLLTALVIERGEGALDCASFRGARRASRGAVAVTDGRGSSCELSGLGVTARERVAPFIRVPHDSAKTRERTPACWAGVVEYLYGRRAREMGAWDRCSIRASLGARERQLTGTQSQLTGMGSFQSYLLDTVTVLKQPVTVLKQPVSPVNPVN